MVDCNTDNLLHLAKYTYYDHYIERAAIKEYDAGMTREQAEKEAMDETAQEFAAIGRGATEEIFRAAASARRLG